MIVSFSKLTRFINGTVKSSVYNFKSLGYLGCIRSLEITFTGDNYHPHFHCCFAFDNLDLNKYMKIVIHMINLEKRIKSYLVILR